MKPGGVNLLKKYKENAGLPGQSLSLCVGAPPVALLRPVVTRPANLDPADVSLLTAWRNRYVSSFLTEFEATDEQTARWLTDMVGPDDTRILFMIDDLSGRTFGYMGLAFIDWEHHSVEADAIVRGLPAAPGTMAACLKALLAWAKNDLGLPQIGVRVRSDNPAVDFYRRLGFIEKQRVSLRKTLQPGKTVWVEDSGNSPVQLVHMTLDPNLLP